MITDQQVRLLMKESGRNKPLATAAAKAGMSERTARRWRQRGALPSETVQPRSWRTRKDPFADVWLEVQAMLELDAGLQAKLIFEQLQKQHPGRFQSGQLRTLQRKIRRWRALRGPDKEVYFPQDLEPGWQCQSDFTDMGKLGVLVEGRPYRHLVYHFVLAYSNWEWVRVAHSESFEALVEGLQESLWVLGAVPREHRTDNLSAATHELKTSHGRVYNERYLELLGHYRMKPSRNTPGRAHENGDIEAANQHYKRAVRQRLVLRGSPEFASEEHYRRFLREVARGRNERRWERLEQERERMRELPVTPLPMYKTVFATVTKWSTARVAGKAYSVPSRLIGRRLEVRLRAAQVEFRLDGELVGECERIAGGRSWKVDYRHVIGSLLRKPGAFERYAYREALFPTLVFRQAYDALRESGRSGADLEYLRILHLAATTLEASVEAELRRQLEAGQRPDSAAIRAVLEPARPASAEAVAMAPFEPQLSSYDELLETVSAKEAG